MAQSGYTPILIYASSTPGALPLAANLTSSASGAELAINYADGKLYFKNSSGVVTLLAGSSSGPAGGSNTQVQYNSSGVLAGSSNLTFDGTSLTLGGNPTLSAGTANGVLYLNGSKVATSGSALTFNGSTLNVITPSGMGFQFLETSSGNGTRIQLGTGSGFGYVNADAGIGAIALAFQVSASEQMRLTSTGLGIGTSSPSEKLTVYGNATNPSIGISGGTGSVGTPAYTNLNFRGYIGNRTAVIRSFDQSSSYSNSGGLEFLVNSDMAADTVTSAMRLDSSGNLGLGVTPSAWVSGTYKVLQMFGGGSVSGSSGQINFSQNFVAESGGSKYIATAPASVYSQSSGEHRWYTAPSGTAGNTITFTQAMTLDASGRLAIGATSSTNPVTVVGTANAAYTSAKGIVVDLTSSSTSVVVPIGFSWSASTSNQNPYWGIGFIPTNFGSGLGDLGFYTAAAERARIDNSGNLLLGGISAGASSAASLAIFNGTAPTGSVTNGIILYAEDVSSSSELKVRDEAGNVTTLSPHNFSLIPDGPSEDMAWAYYSEKGGKRINVDMLKLARMVEKLTGEKLVYES